LAFNSGGDLFVSSIGDNSIRKFSSTGEDLGLFVSLFGIGCPIDLAVDRSGNLLVADICITVVLKFSPTGQDLGFFAMTGLSNPKGLAFDSAGNLFVSNTTSNTIRKFSPTGQDLGIFASGLQFPGGVVIDLSGNLYVASSNGIRKLSATGEDLGNFPLPLGPEFVVIAFPTFAGIPRTPNCHGNSVFTLVHQFGGLNAAASTLDFPDVKSLQQAIRALCGR